MSQRDKLQQFVDKYGHLKVFKEGDIKDVEFNPEHCFIGEVKSMIKTAISYTSFSLEGMHRPIDMAHQEFSKSSTDYSHTYWEKSNTIRKNTAFSFELYTTYKFNSECQELRYCINLTMMDIENMKSVTFNNLNIQEFRKAVLELVGMKSNLIFTI